MITVTITSNASRGAVINRNALTSSAATRNAIRIANAERPQDAAVKDTALMR